MTHLKQWFSTEANFSHPWGHMTMYGDMFACQNWRGLLTSRTKRPGMPLMLLHAQADLPQQGTDVAQKVDSAKTEKSSSKILPYVQQK